jgi:ubiquinone/menaquinone biosynthesis C-methylase UbiE
VKGHWDEVYSSKGVEERSWSESGNSDMLTEVDLAMLSKNSAVIDIGGGASTFAATLVEQGYVDVTVLDISETALMEARATLGLSANKVEWIVSDVRKWEPVRTYDYWNDRAVFHFLVNRQDQNRYINNVLRATHAGSHIAIAAFAPDGPNSCSGLPVSQWSPDELASVFADSCELIQSGKRDHVTPWGSVQRFSWVHLQRK